MDFSKILSITKKYGSFSLPIINFWLYSNYDWEVHYLALAMKFAWRRKYKESINAINKYLEKSKKRRKKGIYYFLLAKKLSFLSNLGECDHKLFEFLRVNISKMPVYVRDTVLNILINIEQRCNFEINVRSWKNEQKFEISSLAFRYISEARKLAVKGEIDRAVRLFSKAYVISKETPHPTALITSLSDLAWILKEKSPKSSYILSQKATYYLGFYKEKMGNLFIVIENLFYIENLLKSKEIYKTAEVIRDLGYDRKEYNRYLIDFEKRKYRVNKKTIKDIIELYNMANETICVNKSTIWRIVEGKIGFVRSETLQKLLSDRILENIDLYAVSYPIYNEYIKKIIEDEFKKSLETLKKFDILKRKQELFIALSSQIDCKFRKEVMKRLFEIAENPDLFDEIHRNDYMVKKIISDIFYPHPLIKGRKEAIRKAIERMKRNFEDFIDKYLKLDWESRERIHKLLRNYGRYESVKFNVRIKEPPEIRDFAKKYRLLIQPTYIAFWCEEDGRVRRKLLNILRKFL